MLIFYYFSKFPTVQWCADCAGVLVFDALQQWKWYSWSQPQQKQNVKDVSCTFRHFLPSMLHCRPGVWCCAGIMMGMVAWSANTANTATTATHRTQQTSSSLPNKYIPHSLFFVIHFTFHYLCSVVMSWSRWFTYTFPFIRFLIFGKIEDDSTKSKIKVVGFFGYSCYPSL